MTIIMYLPEHQGKGLKGDVLYVESSVVPNRMDSIEVNKETYIVTKVTHHLVYKGNDMANHDGIDIQLDWP